MRGVVMYGPGDVRVEDRPEPTILKPTDAVIRLSAADQKEYMRRVAPLGDKYLGQHENEGVRKMYGLLKAAVEKHRKK